MSERKENRQRRQAARGARPEVPEPHDPVSDGEDFHPAGATRGALAGGAMGAALGSGIGGPVGGVVGAAIGGVAGGLGGRQIAAHLDRPTEISYWRTAHKSADYFDERLDFERDYLPAYSLGWEARSRWADRPFAEIRAELETRWREVGEGSRLDWPIAERAARDAWAHLDETLEAPKHT